MLVVQDITAEDVTVVWRSLPPALNELERTITEPRSRDQLIELVENDDALEWWDDPEPPYDLDWFYETELGVCFEGAIVLHKDKYWNDPETCASELALHIDAHTLGEVSDSHYVLIGTSWDRLDDGRYGFYDWAIHVFEQE